MRIFFALLSAALLSCGGGETADCSGMAIETPNADADSIATFVRCNGYSAWAAESVVHDTMAPHGQQTRVFINSALDQSLNSGAMEHPVGATSVKEIYTNGALSGWAAMIKVQSGAAGDGWYWYEVLSVAEGASPVAASTGAGLCTGCHSAGQDFFRTVYPLQ